MMMVPRFPSLAIDLWAPGAAVAYEPSDLIRVFTPSVLRAGIHLFEVGKVQIFEVRPDEGRVFGLVGVGRGRAIRATARIFRSAADVPTLSGACACSRRRECEHMAALFWSAMKPKARTVVQTVLDAQLAEILRAADRPPSRASNQGNALPGGTSGPSRGGDHDGIADGSRKPGRPNADGWEPEGWGIGIAPDGRHVPRIEDDWEIRRWSEALQRELRVRGPRPPTKAPKYQLLYIAQPTANGWGARGSSVAILPTLVSLLRRGGYGREKRFDWYALDRDPRPTYIHESDETVLTLIEAARRSRNAGMSSYAPVELHPDRAAQVLDRAVGTGRCHWQAITGPVLVSGETRSGILTWKLDSQGLQRAGIDLDGARTTVLPIAPPWYVDDATGKCGPIETGVPARVAAAFLNAPPLTPETAVMTREHMDTWAPEDLIPAPAVLRLVEEKRPGQPVPRLLLHGVPIKLPSGNKMSPESPAMRFPMARLSFAYGDATVEAYAPEATIAVRDGDVVRRVRRNLEMESAAVKRLESAGLESYGGAPGPPGTSIQPNDFEADGTDSRAAMIDFVFAELPQLEREGWVIETDPSFPCQLASGDADWYADIDDEPGQDWFDLAMGVTIDGIKVNLLPLLIRMIHEDPDALTSLPDQVGSAPLSIVIPLDDGRLLPVPADRARRILGFLRDLYDGGGLEDDGRLRLSALQAPAIAEIEEADTGTEIAWSGGERLRELGRSLRDFHGIEAVAPPRGLHGVLRHYQAEGVSWLQFLRAHGLGGLLADDMGLGKTIQGLALLLLEKESGRADLPSLVVAPTSLMVNWEREAARFAPDLRVLRLQGPDRHARFDSVGDADIVLTTYPLLHRDREALLAREYHVLILDEAQFLKNHKTKGALTAREIRARHRLGFTGTPFENRLMELWSLFNILMPGILGNEKHFKKAFVGPIEKRGDDEQRGRLSARIRPFLLRRTKDKVATELPPKTEIVQAVELAEAQRDLYETIRLAMHARVRAEIAKKGIDRARIIILDALLKLRQVCCDPRLLKTPAARSVKESAKLEALLGMLEEMAAEGRRVLLFSQFTSMLALIGPELARRKISTVLLQGDTRDRETPVTTFQDGKASVFLISLKAGGTGLNLTAADTVVLYDPWWNPAVEDQAADRAHRIGQSKPVFVYKLIVAGSVEEKILAMQERKRALVKSVLAPGEAAGAVLTEQDLEALFEPIR